MLQNRPSGYYDKLKSLIPFSFLTNEIIQWESEAYGYEIKEIFCDGGEWNYDTILLDKSDKAIESLCCLNNPVTSNILHLIVKKSAFQAFFGKKEWRPGRDSDPGPAGDSRIYWTELYYLGISAARIKSTNTN